MERLTSKRSWEEAGKELGQEYGYSHIWKRLNQIEDILGDEYDLDELREMVQAKRDGRWTELSGSLQMAGTTHTNGKGAMKDG